MSRAFVKEPEGDAAEGDLPELPRSTEPNYMTPRGLRLMQAASHTLQAERTRLQSVTDDLTTASEIKRVGRELRRLESTIQNAIVVDAHKQPHPDVRFGATVETIDPDGESHLFTIVGEYETDAAAGLIGWTSPLARSLLGRRVGDVVIWRRPAGNVELEILNFTYPDLS
jgi:transcription elongation GreA/GreB family factor